MQVRASQSEVPVAEGELKQAGGSIGLVVLTGIMLASAAAGVLFIGRANAQTYILVVLAFLATAGVFLLFAVAAGILRAGRPDSVTPLLGPLVRGATEGILVTDANGRVAYTNPAYLDLTGASGSADACPVERVFIGYP